jgi:hypothetical protein
MASIGIDKEVAPEMRGERDKVGGLGRNQVFLTFLFLYPNVFFCLLVFSFLFPHFFLCWYELWRKQRQEKELKMGGEGRRKWRTTWQGGLQANRAPGIEDMRWNINKDNNRGLHLRNEQLLWGTSWWGPEVIAGEPTL